MSQKPHNQTQNTTFLLNPQIVNYHYPELHVSSASTIHQNCAQFEQAFLGTSTHPSTDKQALGEIGLEPEHGVYAHRAALCCLLCGTDTSGKGNFLAPSAALLRSSVDIAHVSVKKTGDLVEVYHFPLLHMTPHVPQIQIGRSR